MLNITGTFFCIVYSDCVCCVLGDTEWKRVATYHVEQWDNESNAYGPTREWTAGTLEEARAIMYTRAIRLAQSGRTDIVLQGLTNPYAVHPDAVPTLW